MTSASELVSPRNAVEVEIGDQNLEFYWKSPVSVVFSLKPGSLGRSLVKM